MDCDTTGVEPDLGLVKTKKLVGGGTMSIVNQTIPRALVKLGYGPDQVAEIVMYINEHMSILGAPYIAPEHLAVFACSMGDNTIHYSGHIRMMGAVQPFISGAISKTVNLPEDVTVEDVEQLHIDAWRLGIKAVAIYRDNCKVAQPLSTTKMAGAEKGAGMDAEAMGGDIAPSGVGGRGQGPCRRCPHCRARGGTSARAGAQDRVGRRGRRQGAVCPAAATPRRSPSGWPTARATSPSASTRTAVRVKSSSTSPSRVRPWPGSWTHSPFRSAWVSSTRSRWPPTCASTPT